MNRNFPSGIQEGELREIGSGESSDNCLVTTQPVDGQKDDASGEWQRGGGVQYKKKKKEGCVRNLNSDGRFKSNGCVFFEFHHHKGKAHTKEGA